MLTSKPHRKHVTNNVTFVCRSCARYIPLNFVTSVCQTHPHDVHYVPTVVAPDCVKLSMPLQVFIMS